LESSNTDYDVLLCNLPYVPDQHTINKSASFEPTNAIFGGNDGLDVYSQLFNQLKNRQNKPLYIITECFPDQQTRLQTIAKGSGYNLVKTKSFISLFELA
jgi:methylase of polypeptide subunit release factors